MSEIKTNKISSLDSSNSDITLDPDGTGDTIVASGNVGIGTVTPATSLDVVRNGVQPLRVQSTSGTEVAINMVNTGGNVQLEAHSGNFTIDADNVLVGKTDTSINTQGVLFNPNFSHMSSTSDTALALNRKTSDGAILNFRKDGTTVGNIGNGDGGGADGIDINGAAGYVGINTGDTNNYGGIEILSRQYTSSPRLRPATDNQNDLGDAGRRFDDIFATNGTIQTSDQNEKQQIASLTSAEMTAAKAISALFKTFKWNDKVAAKGDAARRHAGVIAQEVQTAMTNAGLDAADYAFWCSDTWWETSTDVAAIEADEEAGIEARDAYTRIDTYNTADEAPAGATERTRLGIRYPELLAFVGAATEQRLADIEARLTALENA